MEAFLPTLSNGALLVSYGAPVLAPYLIGQESGIVHNTRTVCVFLLGRLAGYAAFSLFACGFHLMLQNDMTKKMRGKDIPDARP